MEVFLFLLVITTIVFLIMRFISRRRRKEIREPVGLSALNFSAVPEPEPFLLDSIIQMHQKYSNQVLSLHDVFYKAQGNFDLFLFDIEDKSGKESSMLAQDVIAVISPTLQLPRMTFLPRVQNIGITGAIIDRLIARFANWDNLQGLKSLSIPDFPDLARRYYLFCSDEEQAKEFLTQERMNFILKQNYHYAIETNPNVFTIHLTVNPPNLSRQERIQQTLTTALEIARLCVN